MKKKIAIYVTTIFIIIIAAVAIMFSDGIFGISDDKIISEQEKTITWDKDEYNAIAVSSTGIVHCMSELYI